MGDGSDWRFLVDENLNPEIVTVLSSHGIDAEYVVDALFAGADDVDDVLPYCRERNAVLVTNDVHDFNPSVLEPVAHAGIVVVHDADRPPGEIADELRRIVAAYPSRESFRRFESADDWSGE